MTPREQGEIAKQILDFYFEIYTAKFREKPIIVGGRDMRRLKDDILKYNDVSLHFLKACLISYLDLDDDWLDNNGYPLHVFPTRLYLCKQEVEKNFKFYKGTKEEFYTKFIKDNLNKLGIDYVEGGDRQQNTKPSEV